MRSLVGMLGVWWALTGCSPVSGDGASVSNEASPAAATAVEKTSERAQQGPKGRRAKAQVERVAGAVTGFAAVSGGLPSSLKRLVQEDLLTGDDLRDPWGQVLWFRPASASNGRLVEVCSSGEDARRRTPDDVCVHD